MIIKINITETNYNNENYFVYKNELYMIINSNRINHNNRFDINFIDGNKYKFNITKLEKNENELGTIYKKKKFGLPKSKIVDTLVNNEIIYYGNLFFIFII